MTSTATRIVLVDDHPIVRSGIATLFSLNDDLEVVGEAGSVAEGKEVIAVHDPDIAILDLRLPDGPGLDVARWIAEHNRPTRCIVLTSVPTDRALVAAYETGAVNAFLTKEADIKPLINAIREVTAGRSLLDAFAVREASARLHEYGLNHLDMLSPREREVADLVASGFPMPKLPRNATFRCQRFEMDCHRHIRNSISTLAHNWCGCYGWPKSTLTSCNRESCRISTRCNKKRTVRQQQKDNTSTTVLQLQPVE